jgi:hypothetical protein
MSHLLAQYLVEVRHSSNNFPLEDYFDDLAAKHRGMLIMSLFNSDVSLAILGKTLSVYAFKDLSEAYQMTITSNALNNVTADLLHINPLKIR